jgi:AraC-like DNA-binding protein
MKEDINKLTALLFEITKSLDDTLVLVGEVIKEIKKLQEKPQNLKETAQLLAELEALRVEKAQLMDSFQKNEGKKDVPSPVKTTPKKPAEATPTIVDKFKAQTSLNDTIANKPKSSIAVKQQPITSIAKTIGFNDRFLFIREFFDGDTTLFSQTVKKLDTMGSLNEAKKYIQTVAKNWDETTENAQLFLSTVQRRFL